MVGIEKNNKKCINNYFIIEKFYFIYFMITTKAKLFMHWSLTNNKPENSLKPNDFYKKVKYSVKIDISFTFSRN